MAYFCIELFPIIGCRVAGGFDSKILDRIPDLWSATRSRSLDDDTSADPGLKPSDFVIPIILGVVILFLVLEPGIKRLRRYLR